MRTLEKIFSLSIQQLQSKLNISSEKINYLRRLCIKNTELNLVQRKIVEKYKILFTDEYDNEDELSIENIYTIFKVKYKLKNIWNMDFESLSEIVGKIAPLKNLRILVAKKLSNFIRDKEQKYILDENFEYNMDNYEDLKSQKLKFKFYKYDSQVFNFDESFTEEYVKFFKISPDKKKRLILDKTLDIFETNFSRLESELNEQFTNKRILYDYDQISKVKHPYLLETFYNNVPLNKLHICMSTYDNNNFDYMSACAYLINRYPEIALIFNKCNAFDAYKFVNCCFKTIALNNNPSEEEVYEIIDSFADLSKIFDIFNLHFTHLTGRLDYYKIAMVLKIYHFKNISTFTKFGEFFEDLEKTNSEPTNLLFYQQIFINKYNIFETNENYINLFFEQIKLDITHDDMFFKAINKFYSDFNVNNDDFSNYKVPDQITDLPNFKNSILQNLLSTNNLPKYHKILKKFKQLVLERPNQKVIQYLFDSDYHYKEFSLIIGNKELSLQRTIYFLIMRNPQNYDNIYNILETASEERLNFNDLIRKLLSDLENMDMGPLTESIQTCKNIKYVCEIIKYYNIYYDYKNFMKIAIKLIESFSENYKINLDIGTVCFCMVNCNLDSEENIICQRKFENLNEYYDSFNEINSYILSRV